MLIFALEDLACPVGNERVFETGLNCCARVAELADALDSGSSE